jgi:predicted metalloprotease with PDZ domain
MRAMWARYGRTETPYTLDNWRVTLGQVVRDQQWADDFFNRHIAGKQPIDFAGLLARAGLQLRKPWAAFASLGAVNFTNDTTRLVIAGNTLVGTPLYAAGLDRGDRLVSLDGKPATRQSDVDAILEAHKPGDVIPVVFESRGRQHAATVTLGSREQYELVPYEKVGLPVTEEMQALREAWLSSKVD